MNKFWDMAQAELERAWKMHGNIKSCHEALGLIEEEFDEFRREVFRKQHNRKEMLNELIQIAAMCAKAAQDLSCMDE